MGSQEARSHPSEGKRVKISAPPGFVSRTSFILKKVESKEEPSKSTTGIGSLKAEPLLNNPTSNVIDISKLNSSIVHRPWILHGQCNNSPKESPFEQLDNSFPSQSCLPKGVIRGCKTCNDCQKVTARWRPEAAHLNVYEDAPVFHPTEDEFKNMIEYVANIFSRVEPYGVCLIVPPPSWKPPCILKEKKKFKFVTRIQPIHELQKDYSKRNMAKTRIHDNTNNNKRKSFYMSSEHGGDEGTDFIDKAGPEFDLESFEKYADEFKGQYFFKKNKCEPLIEQIEGEYWRIVENPTEEIEILHSDDLKGVHFGSGFPVASNTVETSDYPVYLNSSWNLNNIAKLPGSLLSFETQTNSAVLFPRMHIGMCFSSICWKAEKNLLPSLWYLHIGAPKIWYGISGKDFIKFQKVVRKYFPNLIRERPELLHNLIRQIPPSILNSEGISVHRCIQNPGQFVLILPGAYHSGFDCGFNCNEVGNFAPIDWLPHGQIAAELYREQRRRTSISFDKVLFGAANEAAKAQCELSLIKKNSPDNLRWKRVCAEGFLARALKSGIKSELASRKYLCNSERYQNIEETFDATNKPVCNICLCDLHLSACGCPCSPNTYSCLIHAKHFCSCAWSARFFLIRYDINDLNTLIDALNGESTALHKWGREKLGLFKDHPSLEKISTNEEKSQNPENSNLNLERKIPESEEMGGKIKFIDLSSLLESSSGSISGSSSMSDSLENEFGKSKFRFLLTKKKRLASDVFSDTSPICEADEVQSTEPKKKTVCRPKEIEDTIVLSDDDDDKN